MPIYVFEDRQHSEELDLPMTAGCLLRNIGASRKLIGFRYAEYMVVRIILNPEELQLITKCLYPETARHFGVSAGSVERALRVLIRHCWSQKEWYPLEFIAGRKLLQPPTNVEFLDMMTAFLQGETPKNI